MLCVVRYGRKSNATPLLDHLRKRCYSRRSDKSADTHKVVSTNGENLDDVDGTVLGINSNWELLTPRGFRFYLPGSIGPGWSNVTTTAQVGSQLVNLYGNDAQPSIDSSRFRWNDRHSVLRCVAQECPLLLRKGIEELFPGCLDVGSPQLTIITISQRTNAKVMRWNSEAETEKLTKYFVLAASDICAKLRRIGYWADFINPFSGQPHLNMQKNNTLYETDERFRCLGFKILHRNSCRVISYDNNLKNFLGSLYTTAPASTAFLKDILQECEIVNVNGSKE